MKNKKQLEVIKKVENIRKKNNFLWMEILRIAVTTSPTKSKKVLKQITSNDKKISKLISNIYE
tara:strand:- start:793 stop:981 length:189 start_codon:yes stop_codon:yes gene_type:complete